MTLDRGPYGYFNAENQRHLEVVDAVKDQLRKQGEFEDKELAKEIHPIFEEKYEWSFKHLRNITRGARKWMKEKDLVIVKEDPRGGIPVKIWKAGKQLKNEEQ